MNSGPGHWQSLWELQHGYVRVQQHDWERPQRGDWMTRLEEAVLSLPPDQPVLLAAHSLGCTLVAAWATFSRQTHRVAGALLVAPPDVAQADFPAALHSWRKPELTRLPFVATCVVSDNDAVCGLVAGQNLARQWGADCVVLRGAGHINTESGLGGWDDGHKLLLDLKQRPDQKQLPNDISGISRAVHPTSGATNHLT